VRVESLQRGSRVGGARQVAVVGIALGVVAFWLALPPLHYRAVAVPIVVGVLAIAAGIAAVSRGERRAGWGAVAAGLLGIVGGVFATQATVPHLTAVITWSTLTAGMLR